MNRTEALAYVKQQLPAYLEDKGIYLNNKFQCLNPDHEDNNPSMCYDKKRNKCHCFSCDADYSVIDLIGIEYGIDDNAEMIAKAYELFDITLDDTVSAPVSAQVAPTTTPMSTQTAPSASTAPTASLQSFFDDAHSHIADTDYHIRRGLSQHVIDRFNIGFVSDWKSPTSSMAHCSPRLIIPTSDSSYLARDTRDALSPAQEMYSKIKIGSAHIFNADALRNATGPVFVTEGEIDALSIMSVCNCEAVALGSVSSVPKFSLFLTRLASCPTLLLALDSDDAGVKATKNLADLISCSNIPHAVVSINGSAKDPNAALLADATSFTAAVSSAFLAASSASALTVAQVPASPATQVPAVTAASPATQVPAVTAASPATQVPAVTAASPTPNEIQQHLSHCVTSYLSVLQQDFQRDISDCCVPTGFSDLDYALDGGLYSGLYVVGGISSLGKTTFTIQITDQVAHKGTDVLIFSLEMARGELIAKSISRGTYLENRANDPYARSALTNRGITNGSRYRYYSPLQLNLITNAFNFYGSYAGRIYIIEGVGNIGVTQIREIVDRHIKITGRRPVVLIDYLQILAPHSERMSDKQNTDNSTLELKRISRDYHIPVIAVSSFNRASYSQAVSMEAFKESGAVEYCSDVLIGLQLHGAGVKKTFDALAEKQRDPRRVEAVILKNRNGRVGSHLCYNYYPLFNYFEQTTGFASTDDEDDKDDTSRRPSVTHNSFTPSNGRG